MASFTETRLTATRCILKIIDENRPALHNGFDIPFSIIEADCGIDSRVLGRQEVKEGVIEDLSNNGYKAKRIVKNTRALFRIWKR